MPGENVGSLVVRLEGDLAGLKAALDSGQVEVSRAARQMGSEMRSQAREAKDSFELLGQTVGVTLPRELRRALAEIPAVGAVVSKLFPIAVVGAFAMVIGERLLPQLQKAYNYIESLTTAQRHAAEEKSLRDHIAAMVKQAQDLDRQLRLAGLSGAARAAEEKKIYQEQMEGAEGRVRRIQYEIEALKRIEAETQPVRFAGIAAVPINAGGLREQTLAAKQATEDLRVKYLELGAAALEVRLAQTQVGISTKEGAAAAMKEASQATKEATASAERLLQINAELLKLNDRQLLNYRHGQRPYLIPKVAVNEFPELAPAAPLAPRYAGTKEAQELFNLQNQQADRIKYLQEMYSASRTMAEQYAFEVQKLNIAFGDRRGDDYYRALNQIRQKYDENLIAVREFGSAMGEAFQQGILMGRDWSDILKTLLVDVINLIAKMTILKQLETANASSGGGGVTGFLGSLLGGLFGKRAGGGPVYSGGAYIVGEQGPELFSPSTAGFILPHNALQAAGAPIVVNQDFRGADAAMEYRLQRVAQQILKAVPGIAVAAVKEYTGRR